MDEETPQTKRRAEIIRIVKFLAVGAMNTGVYYGVYFLLLKLGFHYAPATTVGYIAGLINSYIWNKFFVFKASKKISGAEMIRFCVVYGVQYLCNLSVIHISVTYIGISQEIAGLIAAAIGPVISYTGLRFWGFKSN